MSEETEFETVKRLESIFQRLDRSGNGRIDIQDLSIALKDLGVSLQYAEVRCTSLYIHRNCLFLISSIFHAPARNS